MMLYRYLSLEHGFKALQERKLKVGRLFDLNDPYDCFPKLTSEGRDLSEAEAHTKLVPYGDKIGLLCFSRKINDPVMWSHYAERHKGLALGFEYPSGELIYEVAYQKNRSRLDIKCLEAATDDYTRMRILATSFTMKAESWFYEGECRQFIDLKGCRPDGVFYFQTLPEPYLREVVIGSESNVQVSDICMTLKEVNYELGAIHVRKLRRSEQSYEMIPKEEIVFDLPIPEAGLVS